MLPGQWYRWSASRLVLGDRVELSAHGCAQFVDDGHGEQRNVLRSLPQGGQRDGKDVQPEEEVLSKAPVPNGQSEVLVRGRDDADVHVDGPGRAEPLELAVLDDAQQLGLGFDGQIANFVKEDGRAVGQLESPDLRGQGARVRALLPAEELRLDEGRGDGGAVHLHDRA